MLEESCGSVKGPINNHGNNNVNESTQICVNVWFRLCGEGCTQVCKLGQTEANNHSRGFTTQLRNCTAYTI